MTRALWSGLLAALTLTACGQRAMIERQDAPPVEGVIVGGDAAAVIVDPTTDARGRLPPAADLTAIPRRTIIEIDHPGDGLIVGGATLMTLGLLEYVAAGAVSWLSYMGEYAEGPAPEPVLLFTVPALLSMAGGMALIVAGEQAGADSRAAMGDPRAAAYRRGDLERRAARIRRPDPGAVERARWSDAVTLSVAYKSVLLGVDSHGRPGGALAIGLPLLDGLRVEPGVEVDAWQSRAGVPATLVRAPLRLDVAVPLGGPGYALHVQPEVSYVFAALGGSGDDTRHGYGLGLGVAHRLPVSRWLALELVHGVGLVRLSDPSGVPPSREPTWLAFTAVDAMFVRLGARFAVF